MEYWQVSLKKKLFFHVMPPNSPLCSIYYLQNFFFFEKESLYLLILTFL